MKEIIKVGDKYGRLTAIKFDHKDNRESQYWLFKCDCGKNKVIRASHVKNGDTKSCGCLRKELSSKRAKTHGMSKTKIYHLWKNMKYRCDNPNIKEYKYYGARGIKVCKRWLKFENFYEDVREIPEGMSIDRINNDGNYEPKNCRWATIQQQANNKRSNRLLTYDGKTLTTIQWARETNIDYNTLWNRIFLLNWSVKKALTTKIKTKK